MSKRAGARTQSAGRTTRRLPADPRPAAVAKYDGVTGYIFVDPESKRAYLVTTDRRKVIAELEAVRSYTTPRHTAGTTMIMYRAFIDGEEWVGRASGLLLTLRPRGPGGWR